MDLNKSFNGNKTFVKLFYTQNSILSMLMKVLKWLRNLLFKQYELELKAQEGGRDIRQDGYKTIND